MPRCENSGCERNGEDVVSGGPPEVLNHLSVGGLAERHDPRYVTRIASNEHHIARFDRDVRSGADRDADIGRHQRSVTFPVEGVDGGSISMLAVCVG